LSRCSAKEPWPLAQALWALPQEPDFLFDKHYQLAKLFREKLALGSYFPAQFGDASCSPEMPRRLAQVHQMPKSIPKKTSAAQLPTRRTRPMHLSFRQSHLEEAPQELPRLSLKKLESRQKAWPPQDLARASLSSFLILCL
jgi:hypothetical protein